LIQPSEFAGALPSRSDELNGQTRRGFCFTDAYRIISRMSASDPRAKSIDGSPMPFTIKTDTDRPTL
jgi:hypothetical protein